MNAPRFWPLDDDPEDPVYDSLAWDLPGYREAGETPRRVRRKRAATKRHVADKQVFF
jgi:hypothetical protein